MIGSGVIGLAVAASLGEFGLDVVCLERGQPGDGQSAGRTRQFRHLHADPALIELAVAARAGWRRWEERFECTLLGSEGVLRAGATQAELEALRTAGVPAVVPTAAEAAELFPIAAPPEDMLLWDPLGGAIRAEDTIAALIREIGGAALRAVEVDGLAIASGGHSVEVLGKGAVVHRSSWCVVCAGPGTDRLVRPLGLPVHQRREAHTRLTFRARTPPASPLPCFSDRRSSALEHVYALSDLDDRYAIGLALPGIYPPAEDLAADVPASIELAPARERVIAYVRRELPGLDPTPIGDVTRLTTTLPGQPDDGFGIWREGPVLAVAGANLFKFAPVIGERLASAVAASSVPDGPSIELEVLR